MRPSVLCLAIALSACTDGAGNGDTDDDTNDDTSDTNDDTGNGDTDTDVNNGWNGDDNGWEVPTSTPDDVISGNLSTGTVPSDVGWMDDLEYTCGTNFDDTFTGATVYHTFAQVGATDLYVRLIPDQGLDLSLYLLQRGEGSTALPPATSAQPAAGGECRASYEDDGNPSQPEAVCVYGYADRDFSVLIGVAGVGNLTAGAYELEIWETPSTGCIHPND